MRLKTIIDEDFVNYKKASMFIGTISCGGKCCIEAGIPTTVCQNYSWHNSPIMDIPDEKICQRYVENQLTHAIVIGGLEPFEQFDEVYHLIQILREDFKCDDDVILYTGYTCDEVHNKVEELKKFKNIIIKFGRYVPNSTSHFDEVLGITLVSKNQYGEKIS